MRITVYNIKGRVGKTPIALELALRNGWAIATNENPNDVTIDDVMDEEQLLIVPENEAFPDLEGHGVVFDLGGKISEHAAPSIKSALDQSDLVLIPTVATKDTLVKTNNTIEEIRAYKPDLLTRTYIIATHLKSRGKYSRKFEDGEQFNTIKGAILQGTELEFPMMPLAETTAFEWALNDGVSVGELVHGRKSDGTPYVDKFIANRFATIANQLDHLNEVIIGN